MANITRWVLAGSLWLVVSPTVLAASCRLDSPEHRVGVLELYTSEGCSSCPPADEWFSRLRQQGVGQDSAVLLAFHVDYWNNLGWQDPYSQAAFSARQRALAPRASRGVVYTPQVLLDGADYRRTGSLHQTLSTINAQAPGARIRATVQRKGPEIRVQGEVDALAGNGAALVWVAVYENGLYTFVRAGENAGKRLNHDYVVRDLSGPVSLAQNASAHLDQRLKVAAETPAERLGVAIVVEQPRTGSVLQAATVFPLCP